MLDAGFRRLPHAMREWFLREEALRAARAQLPHPDEPAGRALEQARLVREAARRVAAPVEAFPGGSRPALLLSLYREVITWTLLSRRRDVPEGGSGLAALWRDAPGAELLHAAGTRENLEAVRRLLVDLSPTASLAATDEDATRVHEFAEALGHDVEAPLRRAGHIVIQRWLRITAALVVALIVALSIPRLFRGPNLVGTATLRTSSTWPGCEKDFSCAALMVATVGEENPWAEFDLGRSRPVRRIEVRNRVDCCQEQAVPLVAEVGNDRVHWKEVGRSEAVFATWEVKLQPTMVRYVRLRIPRRAFLHLDDVVIR